MANEQVTKTQVDTFSWEQEWDAGVVAELGESDLDLSDKALEVLYVSGDEWEEWGELPGQTSQSSLSLSRSEVQEDGPSGRGTPRMGSRGAVAALLHRDDTSAGRQRDAEIESRNLGIEREWHSLHRRVGAPGVSDSPEATIVLERRTPATKGAGGPPTSGASGPLSAEQEELLQYLGEWESYIREADDFMTSNEMALVTVIRQRTEEWVRKYAGLASPQECHSKAECLKRMAAVVAARKSEWEQRPAAVQALAQAIITVRALSSEPETSPRQTVTSPIKRQADEAEAWMRTEIAVQGGLPKHSDPVVLVHDIAERRRLLQAACVSAFGKARVKKYRQESGHSKASAVNLSQESSGSISLIRPQSIMNEDERVQMIPAARSERPQGGGSPGAAQQPPHRQNQGCVLQ